MKIVSYLLLMAFSINAFADCDFSKGITPLADGSYKYSKECHIAVGKMKNDLDSANTQVADYKKALTLKDLALQESNQRLELYQKTTFNLENHLDKVDSLQKSNAVLYFGLGILTAGMSVWGASKIVKH